MFNIGDKVVCVDDSKSPDLLADLSDKPYIWVKKDKEYKIRAINDNKGIVTGVLLEEIVNYPFFVPLLGRIQELHFAIWRFRKTENAPLVENTIHESITV